MADEADTGALILVLEDIEETRDGIKALLEADGYRVNPVRNEEDAVVTAARERPDLMLVSLGGSDADVIATACRSRGDAGLDDDVPIIVLSVGTIAEGAEVNLGRNVYLTSPDNFDQLMAFLEKLLK